MWDLIVSVPDRCLFVKPFKNTLLRNQEADDLETWYTASGTKVLPNLSN